MRKLLFTIILVAVAGSIEAEPVEGVDPIANEKYILERQSIGKWEVYTYPDVTDKFIMVTLQGKPLVSIDSVLSKNNITVHDPKNSSLTSVEIKDKNNDSIYDNIIFYQQDGSNGFIDAKLIEGRWVIKEYNPE